MERCDITGERGEGKRFAKEAQDTMEKQRDFFGLWNEIMDATENPDDDKFGAVCDIIFKTESPDSKEAMGWLFDELTRIQDQRLRGNLMDAVINLIEKCKYFYLTAGFALGQDYDVSRPEAREQIEYLRKRIREAGIFPLTAKAR